MTWRNWAQWGSDSIDLKNRVCADSEQALARTLMSARAVVISALATCGGLACRESVSPASLAPVLSHIVVSENPNNVLSAVVSFSVRGADSARIRYEGTTRDRGATPFYAARGDQTTIVALGLRPSTRYALTIEALRAGGSVLAPADSIMTSPLPSAIRSLRLVGTGAPSEPYTLVVPLLADTTRDADGYVVMFDAQGDVRWYRRFPGLWPVEAKQQPNGHVTAYVGRSFGWQPVYGHFEELAPDGSVVRTYSVAPPYYTDPHELLLSFADTVVVGAHMLGYELRRFDLSGAGGRVGEILAVHTIERQTAANVLAFRWTALDYFTPDDWPSGLPPIPDLDHPSSLGLDGDGNYIVSFQGMDQIMKIDAATGAVIWRFGGRRNQFRMLGDPLGGFSGQHDVQVLDDGHVLFMDNHVRTFGPARAVEYSLDTRAMTATMVWEYRPTPPVVSMMMGSAQRLANGSTLVGFGAAGRVTEVRGATLAWNAALQNGDASSPVSFYRALAVRSLYGYMHP